MVTSAAVTVAAPVADRALLDDLSAIVAPALTAVMVPKTESVPTSTSWTGC
ncbi:MAG: hypothetical protein QOE13_3268 [Gaiellaceae bacterium]|jgi:citrate lyase beta subunit|nr:hypothetical protein [Gaiellaceae bacterium]